jgi:KUP system potassium uptake protein
VYWFLHVEVLDEPYTMEYKVDTIIPNKLIRVEFRIGFRVEPKINLFFKEVVEDLVKNNEVDVTNRFPSLKKHNIMSDFKFIVIDRIINYDHELSVFERIIMNIFTVFKRFSLNEQKFFELDPSLVSVETVPLTEPQPKAIEHLLKRVK